MNSPAAQDLTWNKKLKLLRSRLDLNQAQMADRLGITREWVSALENGKEKVSDLLVYKIREIEKLVNEAEHLKKLSSDLESDRHASLDAAAGVVAEAAPSGTFHGRTSAAAALESVIREYCYELVRCAAGDPTRLSWILEQLRTHLRPPAHWNASSSDPLAPPKQPDEFWYRFGIDEMRRDAARKTFREAPGATAPGAKETPPGEAAASS